MSVDVVIEDPRWEEVGLAHLSERAVSAALTHLKLDPDLWEVTVLGADDARIAALNADFRGKPQATNVLSWPSAERGAAKAGLDPVPPTGDPELGDLALAFETCQREAAEQGKAPEQHFIHLMVHVVLHLLGYDHIHAADVDLMESH